MREKLRKPALPVVPAGQERIGGFLRALRADPPRSLLIEGGSSHERECLALYWAALLNCDTRAAGGEPCGACPACVQVGEYVFRDLLFVDGYDEDVAEKLAKGEKVKRLFIKMKHVLAVRAVMGEPPRGEGTRVVVLYEAQNLGQEAANALLKSMEEPRPGNVFVLTAPQRERLLPTLVSRSFILTLAWPDPLGTVEADARDEAADAAAWFASMLDFWRTGRGWFPRTVQKSSLTFRHVEEVVLACQREVARALAGHPTVFPAAWAASAPMRRLDVLCDQALQAVSFEVNPTLILDWMAVNGRAALR